jgi:uncharacterized repeat protein (TIGR03803 family)
MPNRILRIGQCLTLTMLSLGVISRAQAQTFAFSTLYNFQNTGKSPYFPTAPVTIDASGNLYGTTSYGGEFSQGTVFEITKAGKFSVLHNFKGGSTDGSSPFTGLVRDAKGNLYGTTNGGGSSDYGTVFKVTSSGQETVIYSFSNGADGNSPNPITLDAADNIYGTSFGGANGFGLAYEINANDVFNTLYSFCSLSGCADGDDPIGNLALDSAGNIYGTTQAVVGNGIVYKLTPEGVETVLHSFDGTDGIGPTSLTLDVDGNLYGTNQGGGAHQQGTLFKLPKSGGSLTTLYNFCAASRCKDGKFPEGPVQFDKSGNIYGTALQSSGNTGSVVWELSATGKETVLYTFAKNVEVMAGLTIDAAGNLYGTTFNGGANGAGSVFKLTLTK